MSASFPLAACGSSGSVALDAIPTAIPSQTPTVTPDPTHAILAAYREFFARQSEISAAPKDQRKALLAPFTAEPELDRVLKGMFAAEGFGEVGYGVPVMNPTVAKVDGDTATIDDCQDTSGVGQKKRSNGKITQHGVKAAKAVVIESRGLDGTWRVTHVDYPDQQC